MNWFERHLNWTLILAVFGAALPASILIWLIDSMLVDWMAVTIIALPVAIWFLRRKNRSLWWLWLWFLPLVWLVFLLLRNKSYPPSFKAQ